VQNSNSKFTEEKIDGLQIFADSTLDVTEKALLSRLHVGMRAKLAVGAQMIGVRVLLPNSMPTKSFRVDYAAYSRSEIPKSQRMRMFEIVRGERTRFQLHDEVIYELVSHAGQVRVVGNIARNCNSEVRAIFHDHLKHARGSVDAVNYHIISNIPFPIGVEVVVAV
jgi:hypothetical protein